MLLRKHVENLLPVSCQAPEAVNLKRDTVWCKYTLKLFFCGRLYLQIIIIIIIIIIVLSKNFSKLNIFN